jgi:molybdopterin biosynthesis enzyme
MTAQDIQKIVRLTPLAQALVALGSVTKPVAPRTIDASEAAGHVLAADVVAASSPTRALALQDGWAVRADDLADAGGYAPVPLAKLPVRVETGDEMPAGTDAVAPLETIVMRSGRAEAVAPVTAGEGVSPAGSESDPSKPLRKVGERVRSTDAAVLTAAGIAQVSVRTPKMRIVIGREDLRLMPARQLIARDCAARGAVTVMSNGVELAGALRADDCDAVVVVGGSGSGARDVSVRTLAQIGTVMVHGIGLTPGETAAIGHVGSRAVLIVPGRLDGALAIWLTLGRRLLDRLAAASEPPFTAMLALSRKITSTVGLAELVPVRHDNANAEPLAVKNLPLWTLAQANGWLLVPPDSEGYPAGAKVAVNNVP